MIESNLSVSMKQHCINFGIKMSFDWQWLMKRKDYALQHVPADDVIDRKYDGRICIFVYVCMCMCVFVCYQSSLGIQAGTKRVIHLIRLIGLQ